MAKSMLYTTSARGYGLIAGGNRAIVAKIVGGKLRGPRRGGFIVPVNGQVLRPYAIHDHIHDVGLVIRPHVGCPIPADLRSCRKRAQNAFVPSRPKIDRSSGPGDRNIGTIPPPRSHNTA